MSPEVDNTPTCQLRISYGKLKVGHAAAHINCVSGCRRNDIVDGKLDSIHIGVDLDGTLHLRSLGDGHITQRN